MLARLGIDVHTMKGHQRGVDLFKDASGRVYVKPSSGKGASEYTGLNLNQLR